MKITSIDTLHCDAGWRPWTFVKIVTDEGLVGWSECTDSHGSPRGIAGVVEDLASLLIGKDPREVERLYWLMRSRTRQSTGSIIQKAIGALENALLDIKARALGVSVCELFGGPVREKLPLYWSHCGTSRVRASQMVRKPPIRTLKDAKEFGDEVQSSGFKAVKTNIGILDGDPRVYMPGFAKSEGGPEMNADRSVLGSAEAWIGALREAVGDDIDIAVDLNYNFKTAGYISVGRVLEKFDLSWLEIDCDDPDALRMIKDAVRTPISSCENLYGARQYRPFFERHAMDIASIDVIWNGFVRSRQIADMAEVYEMNITPHNYNGYLSTFISAQFCALIPNFRIMEHDVDDVPWREELFTKVPEIEGGIMTVPAGPGWGIEVDEAVLREHPWPK